MSKRGRDYYERYNDDTDLPSGCKRLVLGAVMVIIVGIIWLVKTYVK
jgi:hypothetical protein